MGFNELIWVFGTNDNGNVLAITNNKTSSRSQTFTYTTDGLNRLAKAVSGTTWGAQFSYDAWGNLYSATGVTGTTYVAMTVNQTGINNKNQFTQGGYGYDVAGNVLNDGLASGCGTSGYQWNAEGQMSCANGTTYAYDGDGERVKKSSGTLYWAGGVDESDASGNLTSEYVFFGGKRVARRDVSTGTVYYYLSDHLGSSNVIASATGAIINESDFYPFGGERQITSTLANQHFKFTGKERDAETGLDDFGARYYNSGMGRFMSPDWSAKAEPVPYAKIELPQSLNLYSYVRNNPMIAIDPTGHYLNKCKTDDKVCQQHMADFEKQRQKDLKSKKLSVREAAAAWGNPGEDNGANVKFVTQKQIDSDSHTLPGFSTNAAVSHGMTADHKLIANYEFSENMEGDDLKQVIAHEGSHLEWYQNFFNTYNPETGKFCSCANFTHGDTERQAYGVGSLVKPYSFYNGPIGPGGYTELDQFIVRAYGDKADKLEFNEKDYPQQ